VPELPEVGAHIVVRELAPRLEGYIASARVELKKTDVLRKCGGVVSFRRLVCIKTSRVNTLNR